MKKTLLRVVSVLLAAIMVFALVGCKKSEGDTGGDTGDGASSGKKTMRFLSNIQDRTRTEGLHEQMQLDKWLEKNPDYTLDYEFVPNANIQEKTSQYMATDNLPDVYKEWASTQEFVDRAKNGMLQVIWDSQEAANEEGYNFLDGALNKWTYEGKVYGGAYNFDVFIWYYNGEMFEKEGWAPPESWEEFMSLIDTIKDKGYVPASFSGKDAYQSSAILQDIMTRVSGDNELGLKAITGETKWTENEDIRKSFEYASELIEHDISGGTSWLAQDYAGARGLFVNGEIPLYFFGSWEFMMITDDQLSETFREKVDFFMTPDIPGGKGSKTDLGAYFGGGLSAASKSNYPDAAKDLVKFVFLPENSAKDAWEMQLLIPAQNFDAYRNPETEHPIMTHLLEVINNGTSTMDKNILSGYNNDWTSQTNPMWLDYMSGQADIDTTLEGLQSVADAVQAAEGQN